LIATSVRSVITALVVNPAHFVCVRGQGGSWFAICVSFYAVESILRLLSFFLLDAGSDN